MNHLVKIDIIHWQPVDFFYLLAITKHVFFYPANLKPISSRKSYDGGDLGYHFVDLGSAQDLCTKWKNCAGVTYVEKVDWFEPRFGEPEIQGKGEDIKDQKLKLYPTKRNEWSWTKDKSCDDYGERMERWKFLMDRKRGGYH